MNIGFTGTQHGMTDKQKSGFEDELARIVISDEDSWPTFHHGVCIGADEDAHFLAIESLLIDSIHLHPPINTDKMSPLILTDNYELHMAQNYIVDEVREPKDYLERNKDIVNASDVLIVVPGEFTEQLRSGTWSTYRYAKKNGVPRIIIFPDGTVKEEQ